MSPEHPKNLKMTRFICQELLYEFALGRLHRARQEDMDAYLTGCRESQRELEKLKRGLRFSAQSLGTKLSPEFHVELMAFEPLWQKTLSRWTATSAKRGWRILPYAIVLAALGAGLFVFKPWQRHAHNDLTLAEQYKIEPDSIPQDKLSQVIASSATSSATGISTGISTSTPVVAIENLKTADAPATEAPATDEKPRATQAKPVQGYLTRADIEVNDFANSSTKIKEKILALGGKVAGNVELGWLKRHDESYFHFSLPESNREELELFLKTFGPVRISSEMHPRVMPEGQIRIILTVKDGGSTDEGREENKTP